MEKNQVFQKIQALLLKKYPQAKISKDTYLEFNTHANLDMTSLEIVEFIVTIEEMFNIIIDFSERVYTVGDIVDSVYYHLNEDR